MSKNKNMGKRGNLQVIQGIALSLGVMAVVFAIVLTMLGQLWSNTTDSNAKAAIGNLTVYTADVVDWVPIIVTVVVGVGILGLLFMVTKFGGQGSF